MARTDDKPGDEDVRAGEAAPADRPEASAEAPEGDEHRGNGAGDGAGYTSPAETDGAAAIPLEPIADRPRKSGRGGKRSGAGRKPSGSSPSASKPAAQKRPSESHIRDIGIGREAAHGLLAMIEGGLGMAVGPRALMTREERERIEPPLGRILARMTPAAAERIASFADPIMLGAGIVIYARRVMVTPDAPPPQARREPQNRPPAAPGSPVPIRPTQQPSSPPPAPQNGVATVTEDMRLFHD